MGILGIRPFESINASYPYRFGTLYPVHCADGKKLILKVDVANADVYRSHLNAGSIVWEIYNSVLTGTIVQMANWYDRWSGIAGNLVHIVGIDNATGDVLYVNWNHSTQALSSQTTVFNGTSAATGGALSITVSKSGKIYVMYDIDGGPEHGFAVSTDTGATWTAKTATAEGASGDMFILTPGFAVDQDDIICIYWDASADEISRKRYVASADGWTETSISGSMIDLPASTAYPNFSAAVDLVNSLVVLTAWENVDTAGSDLKCWTVSEGAITAKTDVVTASSDDQGLCAVAIDISTNYWYCFYCGKSDGSETWNTSLRIYYKTSIDSGATWGTETALITSLAAYVGLFHAPNFTTFPFLQVHRVLGSDVIMSGYTDMNVPRTTFQLGM